MKNKICKLINKNILKYLKIKYKQQTEVNNEFVYEKILLIENFYIKLIFERHEILIESSNNEVDWINIYCIFYYYNVPFFSIPKIIELLSFKHKYILKLRIICRFITKNIQILEDFWCNENLDIRLNEVKCIAEKNWRRILKHRH